jgi:hypothetical protein
MFFLQRISQDSARILFRIKPLTQIDRQQNRLNITAILSPVILTLVCLTVVALFVVLAKYAPPSSDDFCMAGGVNDHGLFRQLWLHYFEWSGRYSSNALYAVYPLIFGLFDGYKYIPAIMIMALFLALAFFLSRVFRISMFARPVLLSSLCFVGVFLSSMMSPASSLYWMAGAFTYQTANVLLLVIAGLMFQLADYQKQSKNYGILLSVLILLMVVAMGANETSMLVLTGMAVLGLIMHLHSGWKVILPWLIVLLVTLLCFAVVYFSPGNAIRAADFPLRHDLLRSISGSLSVGLKVLWLWLTNPVLIISSALAPFAVVAMYACSGRQLSGKTFFISRKVITFLLMCTFLMPFVLQFPAWWAMGGWPPPRTVDVIFFLFLCCWYISIAAITMRCVSLSGCGLITLPHSREASVIFLVLSVLFGVSVAGSKAVQQVRMDLLQWAEPYHAYLNMRYQQIEYAKSQGHNALIVPDYTQTLPRSIFFNDIMRNPEHWRNICYADYFGLEKIKRDRQQHVPGQTEQQ